MKILGFILAGWLTLSAALAALLIWLYWREEQV